MQTYSAYTNTKIVMVPVTIQICFTTGLTFISHTSYSPCLAVTTV